MAGRTKHGNRVLVVPFGTGVGDMVNMRPLLSAIAAAHPDSRIFVIAHDSLRWLLPEGIEMVRSVHGVRPWRRIREDSLCARLLGTLSVPAAAWWLRPMMSPALVRLMTAYLGWQEYSTVINLLGLLMGLDGFEPGSVPGRAPTRTSVVDMIANALEGTGIAVPIAARKPRIVVPPIRLDDGPTALLNPAAGSTLKEAPGFLWREVALGLVDRGYRTYAVAAPGRQPDMELMSIPGVERLSAPLPELTRMIAGASIVVSVDTGVLHLAAAVGTAYVGLYGATDPGFSGPHDRSLGEVLAAPFDHPAVCADCWGAQMLPSARCPLFVPGTCLTVLGAPQVLAAVERVMRGRSRPTAALSADA